MITCLFRTLIIHSFVYCIQSSTQNGTQKNVIYDTYPYDEVFSVFVNKTTQQIMDFTEDSEILSGFPSRVHVSTNDSINGEYPLFITATQQKGVSSWEIPLVVRTSQQTIQFDDMARTLCPHDAGPNITTVNRPTLQISTSNPSNVSVQIKLRRVTDFYVQVDKEISVNVTPSTPKYYYFSFDANPWNDTHASPFQHFIPRFNYTVPKSVILMIESDDDVCAVVSIQNNSCPVFDNEQDMVYQGYHLTMTTKGGITLTQSMFPTGFYVVFIVKESDEQCTGASEPGIDDWLAWEQDEATPGGINRRKTFRFRVLATISYKEYLYGILASLALFAGYVLIAVLLTFCTCTLGGVKVLVPGEEVQPSTSQLLREDAVDDVPVLGDDEPRRSVCSERDGELVLPRTLTLAGLSRHTTHAHARRADRYFWNALTVAVVYALPVVQLLFTYQRMVFATGDQDLCYYNFLCAHPLGLLSDFNHVYSNIGYLLLGLAFMAQVRFRQIAHRARPKEVGIPGHYGLLYSLGLALIMEGLLSACYHLCPNKMNFQFDSSFMYVIAVLIMVKLYQNRHPDVNASAHSTFMLIAVIMAIGLFGITYPSVYFWVLFTILHLGTCLVLTFNIYYIGTFRCDWSRLRSASVWAGMLQPRYPARAALLALANIANIALAAAGLYSHNKDLARHLLLVLLSNALLYTLFYLCMKLLHRERLHLHSWLLLLLATVAWGTAGKQFLDSKTKWSETPAMSRRHNAWCAWLQMFDSHDTWHALSAGALYFSFLLLLTIDDALLLTPAHLIPVF